MNRSKKWIIYWAITITIALILLYWSLRTSDFIYFMGGAIFMMVSVLHFYLWEKNKKEEQRQEESKEEIVNETKEEESSSH